MQVLQAILLVVATIGIVVIAWATVVLTRGILCETRKIGQATEDISRLIGAVEEELVPTVRDARTVLNDADRLIVCATENVHRVDRVTGGIEHLLDGSVAGLVASKTVKTASATLLSVYQGVMQGIRILRGTPDETNQDGGKTDEQ